MCGARLGYVTLVAGAGETLHVWKLVNDVFQLGEVISHDDVIFGTELDLPMNYVFSVIIYYIYREWLICSFENELRSRDLNLLSLIHYLKIRTNVYSKCSDPIWYGICNELDMIVMYLENATDIQ